MSKDINKSVINLRDSYFCLNEDIQNKLNTFIKNLQYDSITSTKLQELFKQVTDTDITQDNIKYAMLLNNYIPRDMHKSVWEFNLNKM